MILGLNDMTKAISQTRSNTEVSRIFGGGTISHVLWSEGMDKIQSRDSHITSTGRGEERWVNFTGTAAVAPVMTLFCAVKSSMDG